MARYLNDNVHVGQVDGVVADFADKQRVDVGIVLEMVQEFEPLGVAGGAVDERLAQRGGVVAEGEHVVTEHKHFVSSSFVESH